MGKIIDPSSFLTLNSEEPIVYSIISGIVRDIACVSGKYAILVQSGDSLTVGYFGLEKIYVKVGDSVQKADQLANATPVNTGLFQIDLKIITKVVILFGMIL